MTVVERVIRRFEIDLSRGQNPIAGVISAKDMMDRLEKEFREEIYDNIDDHIDMDAMYRRIFESIAESKGVEPEEIDINDDEVTMAVDEDQMEAVDSIIESDVYWNDIFDVEKKSPECRSLMNDLVAINFGEDYTDYPIKPPCDDEYFSNFGQDKKSVPGAMVSYAERCLKDTPEKRERCRTSLAIVRMTDPDEERRKAAMKALAVLGPGDGTSVPISVPLKR